MKLSICVPHYKEPWEVCHFLFDSIAMQQGIDFGDVECVVVNDGEEDIILGEHFDNYPFRIRYFVNQKSGVSATRNFALDKAEGDYVMFCDIDDMFLNNYGLHMCFAAMNECYDAIKSCFIEEQKDANGNYSITRHDKDNTFVHGKLFRRAFLLQQNVRFKPELTVHEDGYFNLVATVCAETDKYIETPFYLWKWNDNSVVRTDTHLFVMRTYDHLMKCREAICDELKERGKDAMYMDAVAKTICDSYYDFNKPEYIADVNAEECYKAKQSFKRFYNKYNKDFAKCSLKRIGELLQYCRATAVRNGFVIEKWTLREFLKHIVTEVKL